MTRLKVDDPILAKLHLVIDGLLKCSLILFLFYLSVVFWLVLEQQRLGTTPPEFHDAQLVIEWLIGLILVFLFLCGTLLVVSFLYIILRGKTLVPYIFLSPEYILRRDAKFITQLLTFDKATLAYGLLKYRHRWLSSEGRAAAFVGDLRKVGLLPALTAPAALLISAATLLKDHSSPFLWRGLVITVAIFVIYNLIAFAVFLSRERPQQVIQLLEYAIQHEDKAASQPAGARELLNLPTSDTGVEERPSS